MTMCCNTRKQTGALWELGVIFTLLLGIAYFGAPGVSAAAAGQPPLSSRAVPIGETKTTVPPKHFSLCQNTEQILFSCQMKGSRKILSLCGSQQLDDKNGYLQYRFGRPAEIELEFPKERHNTQAAFRYGRYTRPLVSYLVVRFEVGGYRYAVHENDNAEEKPAIKEALVSVTSLSSKSATVTRPVELRCQMPVHGALMNLEGIVPHSTEEPTEP